MLFHPEHTLNTSAFDRKIAISDYIEHNCCWSQASSHLVQYTVKISTLLLTLPPLWWACFQGDKHHVTQYCESCNNIVFIVGDGWNFLISRLEAERTCRNAFPPGECRAEYGAKHLLSFVLFSRTLLDPYCLSIVFSIFGHFIHTDCVWFATSHRAVAAYVSHPEHINVHFRTSV